MKLIVTDLKGNVQGELEVQFAVIEDSKGDQAVHDTVVAYMAAQRSGTACTKTVGEVAGSNKKPWKQKGTGRARAGSLRSPLWRGGGVVFGPKPRDFSKKVNLKTKKLALRRALSERLRAGDIMVVDGLGLAVPKTKEFIGVLNSLNIDGTVLLIDDIENKNLRIAAGNVSYADVTTGEDLNTYLVLKNDKIVITKSAFAKVETRLKKD
jgi:large subunit ribosomal protein L4